jgi:uncharacterized protein (TIGR03086 family)
MIDQVAGHQRAQDAFAAVLANVKADQMDLPSTCDEWTVRQVIDHVVGGNQWVQQLGGREPPPLPDDLVAAHAASAAGAHAVFAAPDGLTRPFELPFGTVPGSLFIILRTGDALTHAWDLARSTRQPTDIDPELAAQILEVTRPMVSADFRGQGRPFGEEQPCPEGRSATDQMAAFLGRSVV